MLNQSGLHLNKYGRRRLVNLNLTVSIANTDRSIGSCLKTQCNLRVDETTSCTKITTSNSYPQVQNTDYKTQKILY